MRVLFVCLGNICRSPTAEAVFRKKAAERGVDVDTDSCGTAGYHVGEPPDARSAATGKARGYPMDALRSRQVTLADFEAFDLLVAMDAQNLADLRAMAPPGTAHKLKRFLDYADDDTQDVPDPYYGGDKGFDRVVDLVEDASDGLLDAIGRQDERA